MYINLFNFYKNGIHPFGFVSVFVFFRISFAYLCMKFNNFYLYALFSFLKTNLLRFVLYLKSFNFFFDFVAKFACKFLLTFVKISCIFQFGTHFLT